MSREQEIQRLEEIVRQADAVMNNHPEMAEMRRMYEEKKREFLHRITNSTRTSTSDISRMRIEIQEMIERVEQMSRFVIPSHGGTRSSRPRRR